MKKYRSISISSELSWRYLHVNSMKICLHSAPSIFFSHEIGAAVIPSEDRRKEGMWFRLI